MTRCETAANLADRRDYSITVETERISFSLTDWGGIEQ